VGRVAAPLSSQPARIDDRSLMELPVSWCSVPAIYLSSHERCHPVLLFSAIIWPFFSPPLFLSGNWNEESAFLMSSPVRSGSPSVLSPLDEGILSLSFFRSVPNQSGRGLLGTPRLGSSDTAMLL